MGNGRTSGNKGWKTRVEAKDAVKLSSYALGWRQEEDDLVKVKVIGGRKGAGVSGRRWR